MGLNFHFGNCGVRIEGFALNVGRTKGTKSLKLMERNLTWLNPTTSIWWNGNFCSGVGGDLAICQWPDIDGMDFNLAKTKMDGMESDLAICHWILVEWNWGFWCEVGQRLMSNCTQPGSQTQNMSGSDPEPDIKYVWKICLIQPWTRHKICL